MEPVGVSDWYYYARLHNLAYHDLYRQPPKYLCKENPPGGEVKPIEPEEELEEELDEETTLEEEPATPKECLESFENFVRKENKNLDAFYTKELLIKHSEDAAKMVNELIKLGCGRETAYQLSILCLYDVVMLIDDSLSMSQNDHEKRKKTISTLLTEITGVYDLARPSGLVSVRFINSPGGYKNIDKQRIERMMKKQAFWGRSQIGISIQKKIIDNFVFKEDMKRPLLVMTITDGQPEGEPEEKMENIIGDCRKRLVDDSKRGKDAVAFHFLRAGNNKVGKRLLGELDKIYPNVDSLRVDYVIEKLNTLDDKTRWDIIPKLLLGPIIHSINADDNEELEAAKANGTRVERASEDDEEDQDIDLSDEED